MTADLPTMVRDAGAGVTFCLQAGVNRLEEPVRPRDRQRFVGQPGAVLSGAREVTGFAAVEDGWVVDGQTQRFRAHGRCEPGRAACRFAEDVFIDDAPLEQVLDRTDLRSGTFFFDYDEDLIVVADDPGGHLVEATAVEQAIVGGDVDAADEVEVAGLVVEKFGNPAQTGAIQTGEGTDWLIVDNEVRHNHGVGVVSGTGARVLDNHVHHNGQMGLGGGGEGGLIEGNQIDHNNTAGFRSGWEAGGAKWAWSTDLVVRGNHAHHNAGPGLWTDIDNVGTLYVDNLVEDNADSGIFHEISYSATIRDNVIRRNGGTQDKWAYGAGILIAHSSDVLVVNNLVEDNVNGISLVQQERGEGALGPYELRNVVVADNEVVMTRGSTGVKQDVDDPSVFDRWIVFSGNAYSAPEDMAEPFAWDDRPLTFAEWQSTGHDRAGRLTRW